MGAVVVRLKNRLLCFEGKHPLLPTVSTETQHEDAGRFDVVGDFIRFHAKSLKRGG